MGTSQGLQQGSAGGSQVAVAAFPPVAAGEGVRERVAQCAFTAVHRVRPDFRAGLERYLDQLGNDVAHQEQLALATCPTLHFARWVVIDGAAAGSALLVLELNCDGDPAQVLAHLAARSGPALERIYRGCEGFAAAADLARFIASGRLPAAAFYVAHPGKTVEAIQKEAILRDALDAWLDADRASSLPRDPLSIRRRALDFVRARRLDALPPAVPPLPERPDPLAWLQAHWTPLLLGALALLPLSLPLAALVGLGYLRLRRLEREDPEDPIDRAPAQVAALRRREDRVVQNQLTHLVAVKPGLVRQALLRAVLAVIDGLARHRYNRGDLGGIPSIHFARWVLLDGGRRLLFLSNYDGSWESYLGDFIDKAHSGLTAVWSNTAGFPRSRGLVGEGALDEERFKAWTRSHQVHTHLWYSAYPGLTNADIYTNGRIRAGLDGEMDGRQAAEWLRLFAGVVPQPLSVTASEPEPPADPDEELDTEDIQGLALSGYGRHRFSAFVAFRLGPRPQAGAWLAALLPSITVASGRRRTSLANVAFSAEGLQALGLDEATRATFATEFQQGMAAGDRPRALGDVGDSDPGGWDWGHEARAAHGLLALYDTEEPRLHQALGRARQQLEAAGGVVLWEQAAEMLPRRREHFGFVDGISQPSVRGFHDPAAGGRGEAPIAAGEFVLGYRNAYGRLPDAPRFADGREHLGPAGVLGDNGTYLVVRQLEQRVAEFRRLCQARGAEVSPRLEDSAAAQRFAAQVVGRWPDGQPLALDPLSPLPHHRNANDFGYRDDPRGFGCPVGSHVRRTNPRDGSLGPTPEAALQVANRHRILRRGRSYGPFLERGRTTDDGRQRGLVFMCVNASIGRQFEFVQQQWVENPKFGGLHEDRDPLIGRHPAGAPSYFTVPGEPVRARATPLATLVRLRGGGYFFLPGLRALIAIARVALEG